jgi:stage V sporulation protein D (sporulation-specific penicillin-binding protein)
MNKQSNSVIIHIFSILVILAAIGLIVRLYIVQVARGEDYSQKLNTQQASYIKDENFDRGMIIFKYKDGRDFFAASNQLGYILAINPTQIQNINDTYKQLSTIVEINKDEFTRHATREGVVRRDVLTKLSEEDALKIKELKLPGVMLILQRWRSNPGNELASHVIGFLSERDGQLRGQYGIERQYNEFLRKDKSELFANVFVELYSGLKKSFKEENRTGDLITTLEPNVQAYAEETAKSIQDSYSSSLTGIIIMEPKTGEIRAMAQYPTFDLNNFRNVKDVSLFNNSAVEGVYEMGSIIKPITIAIGLETKVITASTTYNDLGSMTLNNRTFYNYDKKARGVVDMQIVLNNSLNTGVAFITSRVGNQKFVDYMRKMFKDKTNIDLPAEGVSLISNLDSLRDIEVATSSYGQGIAITPIQTIRALAALGNGGLLVQPHIGKEKKYGYGLYKKIDIEQPVQIFSKETSEEISRMLTRVVDEALLGGTVALPNHTIAAKTGTAQLVNPNGGYYEDKYLHSFFGYFPAFDPQFIVLMYTIDPRGVSYASGTLTAPFMSIAKYLINYYEIEPDR